MQVHIYLPENGHPATGLVRTVVKDSTDLDTSAFMDSDGHYSDNNPRNAPNNDPVDDGAWHMVCPPNTWPVPCLLATMSMIVYIYLQSRHISMR